MRKNNEELKVVTMVVLAILVLTGGLIEQYSYEYQWKWVLIPWVRIIFHAVAAITISMILAGVGLAWAYIAHDRMGDWISLVYVLSGRRKKGVLRRLRRINTIFFKYAQPFTGAIIYIIYSYSWESHQAQYYERNIQTDQLAVDIIFSIIGSIIWMFIFRDNMISDRYTFSPKELIKELQGDIALIERNPKLSQRQKRIVLYIIILMVLLIPIWVVISAEVLTWIFLFLMNKGLWVIS